MGGKSSSSSDQVSNTSTKVSTNVTNAQKTNTVTTDFSGSTLGANANNLQLSAGQGKIWYTEQFTPEVAGTINNVLGAAERSVGSTLDILKGAIIDLGEIGGKVLDTSNKTAQVLTDAFSTAKQPDLQNQKTTNVIIAGALGLAIVALWKK